jgi:hypothetical protein
MAPSASKVGIVLWAGSVQGAVATWSTTGVKIIKYRMLITDQVATAPCTEDGSWIGNVPGFNRRGRGTNRRLRPDTIDGQSLIRRVTDRPCDLWLCHGGPIDGGAAGLLHPGPARHESRPTRGAEIRVRHS